MGRDDSGFNLAIVRHSDFAASAGIGSGPLYQAHGLATVDKLDEIRRLIDENATLPAKTASEARPLTIGADINSICRALTNARQGRLLAARFAPPNPSVWTTVGGPSRRARRVRSFLIQNLVERQSRIGEVSTSVLPSNSARPLSPTCPWFHRPRTLDDDRAPCYQPDKARPPNIRLLDKPATVTKRGHSR
jgi:hypothetical protein